MISRAKSINSYIHIPFCRSKCKYCRFASFSGVSNFEINRYVKYLIYEIKCFHIPTIEFPLPIEGGRLQIVDTIYLGGGTPGILSVDNLKEIIRAMRDKFIFDESIEINIEVNPGNITKKNLLEWKKIGINRISIGVQTLNEKSLNAIGRDEKGGVIESFNIIKDSGIKDDFVISVDFIIGLPYVKNGEIRKNIKYLLDNYDFIKHISVYMLEEYYNIPENIDSKFENIVYPRSWKELGIKEEDYLEEYRKIRELLESKGFKRYEISNYAIPGFECKHNRGYWEHKNYIGYGAGAHSFIDNVRFSNNENLEEYYKGNKSFEELSREDILLEKTMFDLRTDGINKKSVSKNNELDDLILNGLLIEEKNKIMLTDKGVLLIDYILSRI